MKDSKSMSGYVSMLGGVAVFWKSSKQTCIARSTMESILITLDKAIEEAEWLRQFLEDISISQNLCLRFPSIAIVNMRLIEHQVILCIMVSLDIFVVDITPLNNFSQMGLSLLTT